jgi:outer membrane immunogenic protein
MINYGFYFLDYIIGGKIKRTFIGFIVTLAIAIGGWTDTPAIAQTYDWTGLYLGGQVGAQWLNSKSSFNYPGVVSTSKNLDDTSFMGGGQVGFNWQLAGMPLALGVESDLSGASHDKGGEIFRIGVDYADGRSELDVQGSIRGRLGWAINRVLLYATSGVGFGAGKVTTSIARDGVGVTKFSRNETLVGWTVGGGIEYALPFSSHWLIRAEYRYTDLGSINLPTPGGLIGGTVGFLPYNAKGDFRTHNAILGVNYKF